MKKLVIMIYKNGTDEPEATVKIPTILLTAIHSLIPNKIKEKLGDKNINFLELVKVVNDKGITGRLLEIEDKNGRVILSAE